MNRDYHFHTTAIGASMPIDTDANWSWRNPLNCIPALLLLVVLLALLGILF